MQLQRAGLESRLRQLQQLALSGGGGSGGRGRGGDVLERERLADAQVRWCCGLLCCLDSSAALLQ